MPASAATEAVRASARVLPSPVAISARRWSSRAAAASRWVARGVWPRVSAAQAETMPSACAIAAGTRPSRRRRWRRASKAAARAGASSAVQAAASAWAACAVRRAWASGERQRFAPPGRRQGGALSSTARSG